MPTTYTHYRFGKDVLSCLSLPLRNSINEYRELFDIGLHGPDIFFYYRAMHKNKVNQIGYRMHEEQASKFFLSWKRKCLKERADEDGRQGLSLWFYLSFCSGQRLPSLH